jgi:hypothetical protein
VALKDMEAISNGSACTSSSDTPSHGIKAMGYGDDEASEAIRMSWCHLTPEVECPPSGQPGCVLRTVFIEAQMRHLGWDALVERVRTLK